jgi:hypothetical protein
MLSMLLQSQLSKLLNFKLLPMDDRRFELIKERLSLLSKAEIQRIVDNIDQICFDEFNYDAQNNSFCPLAMGMGLNAIQAPTDTLIKQEIAKRFSPVNVLKGVKGTFYTDNRKADLLNLCHSLLST